MSADPITSHVAALERALRGPRRTRAGMVAEVHAGLLDAAEAYQAGGVPPEEAATAAVRDFGTVAEVAPSFQDELTARQGRWAAVQFAVMFPAMLVGWDLLWASGVVSRGPAAPNTVVTLAGLLDTVSVLVGLAAATLLAVTFLRSVPPRQVTRAVGLTGTAGALTCAGTSVAMNVAGGPSSAAMFTHPATLTAVVVSVAVLTLILWQSIRTLRLCHRGRSRIA